MFDLSRHPIEVERNVPEDVGAQVIFQGVVRNYNDGRQVHSLEYEAMDSLAIKEGNSIMQEAMSKFPIKDAFCVHRVGHLQVGEIAIRVEVEAAHRKEAFDACQYIVDHVKARVPIWKKEHYVDGSSEWIGSESWKPETVTP